MLDKRVGLIEDTHFYEEVSIRQSHRSFLRYCHIRLELFRN